MNLKEFRDGYILGIAIGVGLMGLLAFVVNIYRWLF